MTTQIKKIKSFDEVVAEFKKHGPKVGHRTNKENVKPKTENNSLRSRLRKRRHEEMDSFLTPRKKRAFDRARLVLGTPAASRALQKYLESGNVMDRFVDARDSRDPKWFLEYITDNAKKNDYEPFDNDADEDWLPNFRKQIMGKLVETLVCKETKCVVCGGELYQYPNASMPVVDAVCMRYFDSERGSHEGHGFFYQIKVKFNTSQYFSKKKKIIHIGSRRWGQAVHLIEPKDPIEQKIYCPNYLCIQLDDTGEGQYKVNRDESFYVLPRIDIKPYNKPYYTYMHTSPGKKACVRYDEDLCDVRAFEPKSLRWINFTGQPKSKKKKTRHLSQTYNNLKLQYILLSKLLLSSPI